MQNLDLHFYRDSLFTVILAFFLLIAGNFWLPDCGNLLTHICQHIQSLMLLSIAIYTYCYAKRYPKESDEYKFWLWTIFWWLMIFGRGISWGRDFDEHGAIAHIYFRLISIVLIALPILGLFSSAVRRQIRYRFYQQKIPVWNIILAFVFLGLSDIIEHHRVGSHFLLFSPERQDLLEELMEIPCFLSLIFVVLYLQRNERNIESNKNVKLST